MKSDNTKKVETGVLLEIAALRFMFRKNAEQWMVYI